MDRIQKEENESQLLHSAASHSANSAGRGFAEQTDPWRTRYERDRDRIIHSSSFRRLMYKTQVFVNHVGDNQRTRLTHSLEVMQVSRSLANALDLNESLCESIALAHDLGHPPFGHSGEMLLNEKMKGFGGFAHNRQSLRIVDVLERRSPEYRGLNLTKETKSCLKKHEEIIDAESRKKLRFPLLEAQLVDLADSTAYHYHDIEDGIREKILDSEKMERDLEIWSIAIEESRKRHSNQSEGVLLWRRAANEILGMAIADVREESHRRLAAAKGKTSLEAQMGDQRLIGHTPKFKTMVAEMHKYLYKNMYFNEDINWQIRRSTQLLDKVFDEVLGRPEHIPARFFETAESTERAACDFISGMTDRYVDSIARTLGVLPAY
ncbi:MAG: deoxyguanosinetriphosphate triphosphohydrolase [Planctomycetes bacterium]|nr:deoxyguanosinetriphosphate triphosphohydrolase [Planctomycetota bacterium]